MTGSRVVLFVENGSKFHFLLIFSYIFDHTEKVNKIFVEKGVKVEKNAFANANASFSTNMFVNIFCMIK